MHHLYRTRHLVARKPMDYLGQNLEPGDRFMATQVDADYFVKCARADDAPADAPAPTQAPAAAPATPIADAGDAVKPSDGLTVAQLREKLADLGVELPAGHVPKADLAAMLDEKAA